MDYYDKYIKYKNKYVALKATYLKLFDRDGFLNKSITSNKNKYVFLKEDNLPIGKQFNNILENRKITDFVDTKNKNKYMQLQSNNTYLKLFDRNITSNKNKYMQLQRGGKIIKCNDNVILFNKINTCWNIAIFTIFVFGDTSITTIQNNLIGNIVPYSAHNIIDSVQSNTMLLKYLPNLFFNNMDNMQGLSTDTYNILEQMFTTLQKRIKIKAEDTDMLKHTTSHPISFLFQILY